MILAYDEFIDFIATGTTPEGVIEFRPSDATRARVAELMRREKAGPLDADDAAELGHYMHIEHVMRLAKARARQHLGRG